MYRYYCYHFDDWYYCCYSSEGILGIIVQMVLTVTQLVFFVFVFHSCFQALTSQRARKIVQVGFANEHWQWQWFVFFCLFIWYCLNVLLWVLRFWAWAGCETWLGKKENLNDSWIFTEKIKKMWVEFCSCFLFTLGKGRYILSKQACVQFPYTF